jgi:hypothetical protein
LWFSQLELLRAFHRFSAFEEIRKAMGKAKKTRKFAEVKRMINPKEAKGWEHYVRKITTMGLPVSVCCLLTAVFCFPSLLKGTWTGKEKAEEKSWGGSPACVSHHVTASEMVDD